MTIISIKGSTAKFHKSSHKLFLEVLLSFINLLISSLIQIIVFYLAPNLFPLLTTLPAQFLDKSCFAAEK